MSEYSLYVEIGDDQIFLELVSRSNALALRVEYQACSVEDELVLATNEVDVGKEQLVVGCPRG